MQHAKRLANHPSSASSQAPSGLAASPVTLSIATLIYVKREGTKHTARDLYIITSMGPSFLHARKLVRSQFSNRPYRLKYTDVYVAPSCHTIPQGDTYPVSFNPYGDDEDDDSDEDICCSPTHVIQDQASNDSPNEAENQPALDMQNPPPVPQDHPPPGQCPHHQGR